MTSPDAPTLPELAERALAREPSLPALEYERRTYTWGEMQHVAMRLRAALAASGAGAQQSIALIARNRPSSIAALIALIAARRSIQMMYAFQTPAAIAQNIALLGPALVVAHASELRDEVLEVLRTQGIAAVAIDDMDAQALAGYEHSLHTTAGTPSEPHIHVLTSGTTGTPKQVPFPYGVFEKHYARPVRKLDARREVPPPLLCFPLGNITGLYSTLPAMFRGQLALLVDRFNLAAWHDYVVRFRPSNGGLPPVGVQMILDANIPREDLGSLEFVGTGAASLDPAVQRAFEARYGIPILLSYGATEFGGPVTAMTLELHAEWGERKFGSVGRAILGAKLRVVDPERGTELSPGEEGILEVVSPLIGPAWIRTSDIALIDDDGFMFHRGRADSAIVRGGFKLVPDVIERALLLHPAVGVAAVVARTDRRLGEVPVAAVQLTAGAAWPGAEALAEHVRRHLPATHIPVTFLQVRELPRTPSMKLDRPALRRWFERDQEDVGQNPGELGAEAEHSDAQRHLLAEAGWSVRQTGDEMHGQATVIPQLLVPGTSHLRVSMLAAWADHLLGLLAVRVMAPRVPTTLELDVHLYRPAPGAGLVQGRARLVKSGRSVLTAMVEFLDERGDVFAEGAGSFMLAGDPNVRLPDTISLDLPAQSPRLETSIAERAGCERRAPGVAVLPRRTDGLNSSNTVHGGLLAVVAEEALLSLAAGSTLSSLSLRYLRPVRVGPAVAKARLRAGLGMVELFDEGNENRLAVTATARVFARAPLPVLTSSPLSRPGRPGEGAAG